MDYLPVFLDIRGRDVLVVGGGPLAVRKAELLFRSGGQVVVVAPQICEAMARLAGAGAVRHLARRFAAADMEGAAAAVVAAEEPEIQLEVKIAGRRAGVPVNVADRPEDSTFVFPAVIDRSPLVIAISTGGTSPTLARHLRAKLERLIPRGYARLAALAGRFRGPARDRIPDPVARRRFWEEVIGGRVAAEVLCGREPAAACRLAGMLARAAAAAPVRGEVYVVGAGPGDPELLTLRALRLMQQCDIVLYDRLVSEAVLDLVRRDAERIDVGKRRGGHAPAPHEIGETTVRLAREGRRVLRLKGGDPLLFGRGGEELELLAKRAIPFEVVPGITAATGCGAYAGIPLTHREHADSCLFVTGHRSGGRLDLDWPVLARRRQTVVVHSGLESAAAIAREMIAHGAEPQRPAAILANGTREDQRVLVTTLEGLPDAAGTVSSRDVGVIVIGEVVRLAPALAWFGRPPISIDATPLSEAQDRRMKA